MFTVELFVNPLERYRYPKKRQLLKGKLTGQLKKIPDKQLR